MMRVKTSTAKQKIDDLPIYNARMLRQWKLLRRSGAGENPLKSTGSRTGLIHSTLVFRSSTPFL